MNYEARDITSRIARVNDRIRKQRRNLRGASDAGYISIIERSIAADERLLERLKVQLRDWK